MNCRGMIAILIIGVLVIVAASAASMMVSIGNEARVVRLQETQLQKQQVTIAAELLRRAGGETLDLPAELK